MTHTYRCARVILIFCVAPLTDCGTKNVPPPATDPTPPGFGYVRVAVESPTPPTDRGEFDIMSQDVNRTLGTNYLIRVVALAGDDESGIGSMTLVSNLNFRCAFGSDSETIGSLEGGSLTFTPALTPVSPPSTPRAINVVADPMSMIGCIRGTGGKGPIDMEGFVRVVATNGLGMTTTSKTFLFNYPDIGSR